jgi:hypothetical protein
MFKPLVTSSPLGSRISMTQHLEGSCSKGNVIKREESYPCITWFMGNLRKRAIINFMARIDHPTILFHGTPWCKVLYRFKSSNSSPAVRISEKTVIMSSNKENQPVQATSMSERHLIRGLARSWLYSCTKVSLHCDKFEGIPMFHHSSRSLRDLVDLIPAKEEEARRILSAKKNFRRKIPSGNLNWNSIGGTAACQFENTSVRGILNWSWIGGISPSQIDFCSVRGMAQANTHQQA